MADYDLPAAFEYIATVTKQPKIDYVGHSQGTLIMFAALSQNNVIIESLLGKFVALAPVVSIRNEGSNLLRTTAGIAKYTETLRKLGIHHSLSLRHSRNPPVH
jgi:pimeloyl-ACP methyl ester carboxylesterase